MLEVKIQNEVRAQQRFQQQHRSLTPPAQKGVFGGVAQEKQ